ncbi:MAG TPA: DUF4291 domain-containing protein [Verrucomicrobiae bacterium]|nr:DUF4291 domain-containing protein [Verrucomicrobiae bacterium]
MRFQRYLDQVLDWPQSGRHILAQFDTDSIYVYQAYRPSIARFAVEHQQFGGDFSFSRMSWIKPNFLWMMYRAGWATKEGQEHILVVRLRRTFFDELLRLVVPSGFDSRRFATPEEWQAAVASSDVRCQWDPDHDPSGQPVERRAVQLGLRGVALRRYGQQELISVEDITPFVAEQRQHLNDGFVELHTPEERVYYPGDHEAAITVRIQTAAP